MKPPCMDLARRAAVAFTSENALKVSPLGKGLIHQTFQVDTPHERFVLQRLNTHVFKNPDLLIHNHLRLLSHMDPAPIRLPHLRRNLNGEYLLWDEGGCWRAMSLIEGHSYRRIRDVSHARAIGEALGAFHRCTHDCPLSQFFITRPRFHDTRYYLERFYAVLSTSPFRSQAKPFLPLIREREDQAGILMDAANHGMIPWRLVHGDPKVDNFVFARSAPCVQGIVDLDTVQPGLVIHDLADALRSICNPGGESPHKTNDIRCDLSLLSAFFHGYKEGRGPNGFEEDFDHLLTAIRLIPFELALRFLTDHLEGNVYFHTSHEKENLVRTQAQFALLLDIEDKLDDIASIIKSVFSK